MHSIMISEVKDTESLCEYLGKFQTKGTLKFHLENNFQKEKIIFL